MKDLRRNAVCCLLVVFCAVVLLSGCGGNPATSDESPYDTGSMYWDVQGVQQAPTTVAWTHVWGQSFNHQMIGSLGTVAGKKLYQGGQGLLELDLATGAELLNVNWTNQHPVYAEGAPLLWQGKLYVILSEQKETELPGVGLLYQRLACLDATTGNVLWQSDEVGTWEKRCGHPLLLSGKVYLAACFPAPPSSKADTTDVHPAVGIWDASTGKLTGRIPLPTGTFPGDTKLVSDGACIYGNATYSASRGHICSSLFCYDPAVAQTRWSITYPTTSKDFVSIRTALAVDGKTLITVFQTTDQPRGVINGVFTEGTQHRTAAAFDMPTGHLLWTKEEEISDTIHTLQMPDLAVWQGIALFTIHDGTLMAVDERTGAQKWSYSAGTYSFPFRGETSVSLVDWYLHLLPMATRDVLYVQEGESCLVALDPTTGAKLWQKTLLTREELETEEKQICCIVPVDKGLIIVTANTSDMRPIIELWK